MFANQLADATNAVRLPMMENILQRVETELAKVKKVCMGRAANGHSSWTTDITDFNQAVKSLSALRGPIEGNTVHFDFQIYFLGPISTKSIAQRDKASVQIENDKTLSAVFIFSVNDLSSIRSFL